jgi:hypothetical protein
VSPKPSTPEQLRAQVRSMAVLCAVLGPTLVVLGGVSVAGERFVQWMLTQRALRLEQLDVYQRVSLSFGARSLPLMLGLGGVLFVVGVQALRRPAKARATLVWGAWASIAAMFLFGVVWSVVVAEQGEGWLVHVGGWFLHLIQAGAVGMALRLLLRPDVRAACDSPPPTA